MASMWWTRMGAAILLGLFTVGCGRARLVDDPLPDAGVDAPSDAPDADFVPPDRGVPDRGLDASGDPSDPELLRTLTCGLDEDGALAAAVRFAACTEAGAVGLAGPARIFNTWEAFGLGALTAEVPFPAPACPYWQCLAEASNCEEAIDCESIFTCDGSFAACTGNLLRFCRPSAFGPSIRAEFDCAAFGGVCAAGRCRGADGCSFGPEDDGILRAEGNRLVACGGASIACEEGAGVAVLDADLLWCGPDVVREPVSECEGDTLVFQNLQEEPVRFDCIEAGYGTCAGGACFE